MITIVFKMINATTFWVSILKIRVLKFFFSKISLGVCIHFWYFLQQFHPLPSSVNPRFRGSRRSNFLIPCSLVLQIFFVGSFARPRLITHLPPLQYRLYSPVHPLLSPLHVVTENGQVKMLISRETCKMLKVSILLL